MPEPQPVAAPNDAGARVARIVKIHGVPTLEVDGSPLLLVGAQCDIWRSTCQDEKTIAFFDASQEMNATCVSVGIPWSKTETARDCYDFPFLHRFIEQAQKHGLKLVLNLFNSNVCGKIQESSRASSYPVYQGIRSRCAGRFRADAPA